MRTTTRRRSLFALPVIAAFMAAMVGFATPASADPETRYFSVGQVSGSITFMDSYRYVIRTTVHNPYPGGSVGSSSVAEYFAGNGRYTCGTTAYRVVNQYDVVRTWTDTFTCSYANIHLVTVREFRSGSLHDTVSLDNPHT